MSFYHRFEESDYYVRNTNEKIYYFEKTNNFRKDVSQYIDLLNKGYKVIGANQKLSNYANNYFKEKNGFNKINIVIANIKFEQRIQEKELKNIQKYLKQHIEVQNMFNRINKIG